MSVTPKQKADELLAKFGNKHREFEFRSIKAAKQCALLCVDEILSTIEVDYDKPTIQANFWIWVKRELNNDSRK